MLAHIGRFLFRTRNALFPVLMVLLVVAFHTRGFDSPLQDALAVVGVVTALAGQAIRVVTIGLDYVKRGGKAKRIYANRLVTGGIYAHTRNPMYLGNLLVVWGLLLVVGNPWAILVGGTFFTIAYLAITKAEERYLEAEFGAAYRAYCVQTPRFVPRPSHLIGTIRAYRFDWAAVVVKEYGTIFTTLFLLTVILAWKSAVSGQLERLAPIFLSALALWVALYAVARYLKKRRGWLARGTVMSKGGLEERRRRLDEIDNALLALLNRRATEVSAIYEWKRQEGVGRVDPTRIEEIIVRLQAANLGPLTADQVRRLFAGILFHFSHEHRTAAWADPESPDVGAHASGAATAAELHLEPPGATP